MATYIKVPFTQLHHTSKQSHNKMLNFTARVPGERENFGSVCSENIDIFTS